MNALPTTQSVSISMLTTSRLAARARVIPVYATSIPPRAKHPLSIHNDLPSRPYIRARVDIPPINTSLSSSSEWGESPLTPVKQALASGNQPRPILIPQPHGSVTVTTAGWLSGALKEYRQIARQAVEEYFDIQKSFAAQGASELGKARDHVESATPFFKVHQDHWGANLLLKEQLKSKKDTQMKAKTCAKEKKK